MPRTPQLTAGPGRGGLISSPNAFIIDAVRLCEKTYVPVIIDFTPSNLWR